MTTQTTARLLFLGYLAAVLIGVGFDLAIGLAIGGLMFWFRLDLIEDEMEARE